MIQSNTQNPNGPSRLSKHLEILDLGNGAIPESELLSERRAIDDFVPRKLRFPEAKARQPFWRIPAIWALASVATAALVLVIFKLREEAPPAFQVMGVGGIQLFIEQDGRVLPWTPGLILQTGARVKAEVLESMPAIAFWGVASRDHRLLSESSWTWQNRLELRPAEKKAFTGSLQLDAASEGETLVVVICPKSAIESRGESEIMPEVNTAIASAIAPTGVLSACRAQRFSLRP